MISKQTKEWVMVIVFLAWIPLGILAFYFSPLRVDVKLAIAALASFTAMIIFFIKEE